MSQGTYPRLVSDDQSKEDEWNDEKRGGGTMKWTFTALGKHDSVHLCSVCVVCENVDTRHTDSAGGGKVGRDQPQKLYRYFGGISP